MVSTEPQNHGAVRRVPTARQRQRTVKIAGREHRPRSVRARRPDADLEDFKKARFHENNDRGDIRHQLGTC